MAIFAVDHPQRRR